jgi:RNA polymerase sigma factor (sigma-70 family)
MRATSLRPLVRCLARLAGAGPARDLSDADLLERFRAGREEAAFTLLVQRHGPAVLGLCRRLLGNCADADDAFQATFLVLLRKADSIRKRASLGSWLHGVAFHVATRARARRPAALLPDLPAGGDEPGDAAAWREVRALLDEEISRLPERYRAPLVLCGLEGKTCEQAARELGWPKSSLAHRLGRAKDLLRDRLLRRGVAVPAAVLTAALAREASAAVPALLALGTVRLAAQALAGGAPTSAPAVALAGGVARGVTPSARAIALALAVAGLVIAGAGLLAGPRDKTEPPSANPSAAKSDAPAAEERKDREGFPLPAEALARVGSARLLHARRLHGLTYSPDGKVLASSGGGLLRLWDAGTGKLLRGIPVAEGGRIPDGLFSADGKTVVVLDGETCRWFDVSTGKEVRHCAIKFPKTNSHACFAPHGEALAVVGTGPGQDLVVYDLPSGKERFRKTAGGAWSWDLAFSPDGKVLAALELVGAVFKPKRLALLDTAGGGKLLGEFDPGEMFRAMHFSADGKKLLGLNFNTETLLVWSVPGGESLHRGKVPVNAVVTAAFTPDGSGVVVGSQGLDAVLIDLATGQVTRRFRTYPSSVGLAFTPDGKRLAVGVGDGLISQWDLATGERLVASAEPVCGYLKLQFDTDGKTLWAASDTFAALDWRSGREVRRARVPHEGASWALSLSPDRSRVAGLNADHKRAVWDAVTGKELCVLAAGGGWTAPAFSPDGKTLYTAAWTEPVRTWDASTGKERPAFDREQRVTHALVASPDGRWLAAADHPQAAGGARREVTVWDLTRGREAHRFLPTHPDARAWAAAFSPDSTLLAAAGGLPHRPLEERNGFVVVWDLRTGKELMSCSGVIGSVMAVAFSPDGRLLVTGGQDSAVQLWEVAGGRERHRFAGHESGVYSVAFSPDGKLVASSSADAPVFVWDVTGCYDRPPAGALGREEQDQLWTSLADTDATAAFGAMRRLLARPGPATALLAARLKPAAPADAKAIEQHLRDLDADDFGAREKAAAELAKVADQAEPLLRKALASGPSAEAKRQIELLLAGLATLSAERLREVRAVEVLEHVGTAEARKLLDEIAGGTKDARLTREAKAAVERLAKRAAGQ